MGYCTGRASVFSTGSVTITTGLTGTPTWARIICGGKGSDTVNHGSVGTMDGTRQNVQYWSPASSGSTGTDVIWLKDAAGTTQLKAAWTSFGVSGSNGTVVLNVGTLDSSFSFTLEVGN